MGLQTTSGCTLMAVCKPSEISHQTAWIFTCDPAATCASCRISQRCVCFCCLVKTGPNISG